MKIPEHLRNVSTEGLNDLLQDARDKLRAAQAMMDFQKVRARRHLDEALEIRRELLRRDMDGDGE